ncbi:hypothetical protein RUND412_007584 [Rhizina undulata]
MSYFSTLLTATKTRYNNLRGDEVDGDSEHDSHISRVLRNYYNDQGRGIPEWLGGGPANQNSSNVNRSNNSSYGRSTTGSQRGNPPPSLSDIFDSPAPSTQAGRPNFTRTQQQRPNLFPGDRADSTSGSGLTAQQRIKERLRGTRTASPPPNQQQQQMPPQQPSYEAFNYSNGNGGPTARPPANGGGAGGYQSYKPQGQMPPPSLQPGGVRNHGGGMPWDDGSQGHGARKPGLPAGPKMLRQGGY